jgi:hypothetical protein
LQMQTIYIYRAIQYPGYGILIPYPSQPLARTNAYMYNNGVRVVVGF